MLEGSGFGSDSSSSDVALKFDEGSGEGSGGGGLISETTDILNEKEAKPKVKVTLEFKDIVKKPFEDKYETEMTVTVSTSDDIDELEKLIISMEEQNITLAPPYLDNQPGLILHLTTVSHHTEEHFTTFAPIIPATSYDENITPTTNLPIATLETPYSNSTDKPLVFNVIFHEFIEDPTYKVHEVKYHYEDPKSENTKNKPAPKASTKAKKLKKSKKRKNQPMETTIDPFAETVTFATVIPEENDLEIVDFIFNITDFDTTEGP